MSTPGHSVVVQDVLPQWGEGPSRAMALADLARNVVEMHDELHGQPDATLGPAMREARDLLCAIRGCVEELDESGDGDSLWGRAKTRATPLLSKLADLNDEEWSELTHRLTKHFQREMKERGYEMVATRLSGITVGTVNGLTDDRIVRIVTDADYALRRLEEGDTLNALAALRRGFQRAPVGLRSPTATPTPPGRREP